MSTPQKIAAFTLALAVVFAAAFGIGMSVRPNSFVVTAEHSANHDGAPTDAESAAAGDLPEGLTSTQDGYTLELMQSRVDSGKAVPLSFRITDSTGTAVTQYVDNHEKELHLIVVRRDMVGFQHVHPIMGADGTWSSPLNLSRAGDYRLFADFVPIGGEALTLGADLHVAGSYDPEPLPPANTTATVEGYVVTLTGNAEANEPVQLTLSASREGKPVTDLEPYLGAYGHLVVLRAGDLAYLHMHPVGERVDGNTPAGPEVGFHTTFPSNGDYRLFLDFQHRGVVRTAEFTMPVGSTASNESAVTSAVPAPTGHGH